MPDLRRSVYLWRELHRRDYPERRYTMERTLGPEKRFRARETPRGMPTTLIHLENVDAGVKDLSPKEKPRSVLNCRQGTKFE